ncbi:MAG: VOC family protein [Pseudomonadota bacterium]
MRLSRICFNVRNAAAQAGFYRALLGMEQLGEDTSPAFGYHRDQALLEFHESELEPYEPAGENFYWKIGITLQNLDCAVEFLNDQGWPVSAPRQFRDIGYMCHLSDPEGFPIELLQQGFEGNHGPAPPQGHPIGAQAILAHLTLRVANLRAAEDTFAGEMNMRLMSVQPVPERSFCLYFYSWSDAPLPEPDLDAVGNREWLWARPFTLLELQHLETEAAVSAPRPGRADFAGFAYGGEALTYLSADQLSEIL